MCQTANTDSEKLSHCINVHIANRSVAETIKSKGGKKNNNNYNNRDNGNKEGNNF